MKEARALDERCLRKCEASSVSSTLFFLFRPPPPLLHLQTILRKETFFFIVSQNLSLYYFIHWFCIWPLGPFELNGDYRSLFKIFEICGVSLSVLRANIPRCLLPLIRRHIIQSVHCRGHSGQDSVCLRIPNCFNAAEEVYCRHAGLLVQPCLSTSGEGGSYRALTTHSAS